QVRVLLLREATRERDLPGVPREMFGPPGEDEPVVVDQGQQHRGEPIPRTPPWARGRDGGCPSGAGARRSDTFAAMVEEAVVSAVVERVDPDEVLRFARRLITTPSENPGGTEDAVAAVAVEILEDLGGSPELVRGEKERPSVVARFGTGDRPALAWNGHLDVVPAGAPPTGR